MRVGVHEHRVHGGWGEGGKASIYSPEEASSWPTFTSIQEDQSLSRFAQGSGKGHRGSLPILPANADRDADQAWTPPHPQEEKQLRLHINTHNVRFISSIFKNVLGFGAC